MKKIIRLSDSDQDQSSVKIAEPIIDQLTDISHSALEKYDEIAQQEPFRGSFSYGDKLHNSHLAFDGLGTLYNFWDYGNQNPHDDISNSLYAGSRLIIDELQDNFSKLALSAGLAEELAEATLGSISYFYSAAQVVDAFYPQIKKINQDYESWLNTLNQQDRNAVINLDTSNGFLGCCYVPRAQITGLIELNHQFLAGIDRMEDKLSTMVSHALTSAVDFLQKDESLFGNYGYLYGTEERCQKSIFSLTFPMKCSLYLGGLTQEIKSEYAISPEAAMQLLGQALLANSPLVTAISDMSLPTLPDDLNKEALINAITDKINNNPTLLALKHEFDQKQSLAERLDHIRQDATQINAGIIDAEQLGGTIAHIGQLVKSPTLYKAGIIFKNGVQIIAGVQQLLKINSPTLSAVFKKLGSLNLGTVSMIASAVSAIIGLFHDSGPTGQEIIIKQLDQIQQGINTVIKNQAVMLQAMDYYYQELLHAIQHGVNQLTDLMNAQFNRISDELYVLDQQLHYSTQEILNEIRRAEFTLEEVRLQPLRDALEFSKNFRIRYPQRNNQFYDQELRKNIQTLEHWSASVVCDRSLSGDVETDYHQAIQNNAIIFRHFPQSTIKLHHGLTQSGFLYRLFQSMMPNLNDAGITACNMDLWSQVMTAYQSLVPHTVQYSYDADGHLLQQMLKPADQVKSMVKFFQQHAFDFIAMLQTLLVADIEKLSNLYRAQFKQIKSDILKFLNRALSDQEKVMQKFLQQLANPQSQTNYLMITDDTLRALLMPTMDRLAQRIETKQIASHLPLATLISGKSLKGRWRAGIELSTPLASAFPFLATNHSIPTELLTAELLSNGVISGNFYYQRPSWSRGNVVLNAELYFKPQQGNRFNIAEVTWTGSLYSVKKQHAITVPFSFEDASYVLNALPLFPLQSGVCQPITHQKIPGYGYCIEWTYAVKQIIAQNDSQVEQVIAQNKIAIMSHIAELDLVGALTNIPAIENAYLALEAKWRILKVFAMTIGIEKALLNDMNQLDIKSMIIDNLNLIDNVNVETWQETPEFGLNIRHAFTPFFDALLQHADPANATSNSTGYNSSLANFIDYYSANAKLVTAVRKMRQEFQHSNKIIVQVNGLKKLAATADAADIKDSGNKSWFFWGAFLGTSSAMLLPASLWMLMLCRARYGQRRLLDVPLLAMGYHAINAQATILPNFYQGEHLVAQLVPSTNKLYSAYWDEAVGKHHYTQKPVFTLRVFFNGNEVGDAQFYHQPLLCRSEDGSRHNIIETTGLMSKFSIQADKIDEICQSLPPTRGEKFQHGLMLGVHYGVTRKTADFLGWTMEERGASKSNAALARTAFYYAAMFLSFTAQHYAEREEQASGIKCLTDSLQHATLNVICLGLFEKISSKANDICNRVAQGAKAAGWHRTAALLRGVVPCAHYGLFAFNQQKAGVERAAGIVLGGVLTEKVVEVAVNNFTHH